MRRACLALAAVLMAAAARAQVSDDFERIDGWQAVASDGVQASLSSVPGQHGQAMRLAYDFRGAAGYAAARRTLPIDFGANYTISFWVRAEAPVNNLEFKLVDASGDNVWWVNRPNIVLSGEWQKITFKPRHVAFAWGPSADHSLRHTEKLELVVSAGRDGGRGQLEFDQLEVAMLDAPAPLPAPIFSASSGAAPAPATGAWTSDGAGEQQLTIDFGGVRALGGLILHWQQGLAARRYDIDFSDDGSRWRTLRRVARGNGGDDPILLGEGETRYLRLALHEAEAGHYGLAGIDVKDLDFGASPNAFFQALAKTAPPGSYPRGMSGQQNYWTVLGVDGGHETGLLSEDGALEVARGGFTVEPFVIDQGKRFSWADVTVSQSLRERYLPIPSVTWSTPRWSLTSSAFAHGTPDAAALGARYELRNLTSEPLSLRLLLALRPFQVNPPSQFLNTPPGVSPISDIAWDGAAFAIDGKPRVFTLRPPAAAGVSSFDAGEGFAARALHDDSGFASGAAAYDVLLAPGASTTIGLHIPLTGTPPAPADLQATEDAVAAFWRERLNRASITVPAAAQGLVDTLRSSLAHMLMSRDGAMLRPGTRSYARSWMRDGAMISEAMLRLGDEQVARDYLEWVAPFQFADGKVPCCVDRRGADPVPENDSQGEFIFLNAQLWKFTHDRVLLERMWPRIEHAAAFMEAQRQSGRTAANRTAARRALFGLLPASISHEGYSAKPMHSYWDDFWGLRGYRDAATLAASLGKTAQAAQLNEQGNQFETELLESLRLSASEHHVNYLPGAAELGDFDATSTTIALSPGGLQARLPQDLLQGTFERYWSQFSARRDGSLAWNDYTPYELRNVAAFVRLGWRGRAHELLDFFMHDRRPLAWNQWAEVVGRDARAPRFVGDMPHGWISSDFIRSALDLFAYDRPDEQALVVGAGIPRAWLRGAGVAVRDLRTTFGTLGFSMREQGGRTTVHIGAMPVPRGGIVLRPDLARPGATTINGASARWHEGELRVRTVPATIIIESAPPYSKATP
jgi:hypothetical protein